MTSLADAVAAFFEADGWPYTRPEGGAVIHTGFQGENGRWTCYAEVREAERQLVFYSVAPLQASGARRPDVAEFLTRANYGLVIGNFEMSYADGRIYYKTSIDVEGGTLTPALARNLVHANVSTMDRYLPGIEAVERGHASPAAAVEAIDG